ncbi:alpha-N-acetylglucosaminidase isoform X1 [Impatiens glandulifera]|uniref:alpha-N-acetylglucosaminidase isoform X1 n=1 Tax=Impatiens glandulifera TaxID=253017 RepID=UPI001FB15E35|nr:alpha-N-acetylglucosaminidase isoform X1 [Impatiens glandulifera]
MSCSRFLCILLILSLPISCFTLSPPQSEVIDALLRRLDSQRSPASVQESAARGVLQRLIPNHVSSFEFKIVSKERCGGKSCFWIINNKDSSKKETKIIIEGTSAVEISSGLHWYLKYHCGVHISWDKTGGSQIASLLKKGSILPLVPKGGVKIQRPVPWNYYQNVVTSSYSYVWWDWKRWEKEIDWMALQGVNLPLAFTGQESIWQKVFFDYNITMENMNDFFGGPAFLAWARMGNLHAWGGPLSQNWLDQQLLLQKKILSRMIELGMTPVLPSFSGNVPSALKEIFPSAKITRLGDWNTVDGDPQFCCTYLLDPSDPLFEEIGESFIKQQIREYGDITDIYNCDTFNENTPPTHDPSYISSLGAAVYRAMSKADKNAVWLMQGWLFSSDSDFWKPPQMEALLNSVPFGKMIVLDLFAEVRPMWKKSSQFYGTPYIWCMLHNFGGNIEMYGTLDIVGSGPVDARLSDNSTMVGVGMCMEGIEQNPVVYELMSEMGFREQRVIVKEWLKVYLGRRYGKSVHQVETAWEILHRTIYNCTDGIQDHNTDFIVKLPDWDPSPEMVTEIPKLKRKKFFLLEEVEVRSSLPKAHLWYSTEDVIKALGLLLDGAGDLHGSLTYRYDLVDLTRQTLSKLANEVYLKAMIAFQEKNSTALSFHSGRFLELIKDIDEVLAADDNYLLGTWLESAKELALNPTEKNQYEWNARTQVTMWYDTTQSAQSQLHDYANKFWSGLLEDYYLPRASMYFAHLSKSLRRKEKFEIKEWRKEWIAYSRKWQRSSKLYPIKGHGNALVIAKTLNDKYFFE